jgi:DNA (cytosine-5)-methyltransferase 1
VGAGAPSRTLVEPASQSLVHGPKRAAAIGVDYEVGGTSRVSVLPEPNDLPALTFQRGIDGFVAFDISSKLGFPVRVVRLRKIAVLGTAMPEATVYEHCQSGPGKDNVRSDKAAGGSNRVIDSIPQPPSVKLFPECQLRLAVAPPISPHSIRDLTARRRRIRKRGHVISLEDDGRVVRSDSDNRDVKEQYTAVSLYAGAGGLDKGFAEASFRLLWAVDADRHAVDTYRANIGDHIVHGELPAVQPPQNLRPDLVIGGPPCQGFSVIGRMDPDDPRSEHVNYFLNVVENLKPRAFCMENVRALAESARWADIRDGLLRRASALGFQVELMVLRASDYGVPQARDRMFLVGVRDGEPLCPVPTSKGDPPTVRGALSDLPPVGSPGNNTMTTASVVPATKPIMRPSAHKGSLLFNGSGRPLLLDAPAKTLPASMGGNATPILDQKEFEHGAEPWVVRYHARLKRGLKPVKRAPQRMRRITVEEAAALQSFPIGWQWRGPRGAQYKQVGNAVPPALARRVALSLREALEAVDLAPRQQASECASGPPLVPS